MNRLIIIQGATASGKSSLALSLAKENKISNFEKNLKDSKPWIFND